MLLESNKKPQGQFHLLLPRLHTRLHPLNAISTSLQTPNFYEYLLQSTPATCFFYFSTFEQKIQKITKNARVTPDLCVQKVSHEEKKHVFYSPSR